MKRSRKSAATLLNEYNDTRAAAQRSESALLDQVPGWIEWLVRGGKTATEIADAVGVGRSYLSQIRNQHKPCSPEVAVRIARLAQRAGR
jgi:AraC-like DNA-binding protein